MSPLRYLVRRARTAIGSGVVRAEAMLSPSLWMHGRQAGMST